MQQSQDLIHLSSQFDAELSSASNSLMELGGLTEKQIKHLLKTLKDMNANHIEQVLDLEQLINQVEVKIDKEVANIIARRQPAARDLRLLIAILKGTSNLERVGDELTKVAYKLKSLIEDGVTWHVPLKDLRIIGNLTADILFRSLDSLVRLDVANAIEILQADDDINQEFDAFTRQLITYMMEDPRTISKSLELIFIAKAFERVGDHAKNIAELVVYVVRGEDVRHRPTDEIVSLAKDQNQGQ